VHRTGLVSANDAMNISFSQGELHSPKPIFFENCSCTNIGASLFGGLLARKLRRRHAGETWRLRYRAQWSRGHTIRKEGEVFVACSTLCFRQHSLDEALKAIGDLKFSKIDLAIHEHGSHLKPSEVATDVHKIATHLKNACPLGLAAFHVSIHAASHEEHDRQLRAVCKLARITTVPIICVPAPAASMETNQAITRLSDQVKVASGEGVILTIETKIGTLAESPEVAIDLCEKVPGLGLTLDPSDYLVGPARDRPFDDVFPYVRHVRLRDTGATPNDYQVRVGQGQVDYGRIVNQLERQRYDRLLTVDIQDSADARFPMEPEVRKLKYLLESLV